MSLPGLRWKADNAGRGSYLDRLEPLILERLGVLNNTPSFSRIYFPECVVAFQRSPITLAHPEEP